jgi:hypothetical protein
VKADSKQFNEMMARCLAGECSEEELVELRSMLLNNPDLKTEYELFNLLFGKDKCSTEPSDKKDHFNRITKRLADEGLM